MLEALPSIALGFVVLAFLDDRIADAKWLSRDDKKRLQRNIVADQAHIEDHTAAAGFRNPKVWILVTAYFGFIMGLYGVGFWLPSLAFIVGWIKDTTGSSNVGLYVIAASLVVGACVVQSLSRRALDR